MKDQVSIPEVKTIQELKRNLCGDGQGSGTRQGWVIFNGKEMFVRKHWSYSGGFPAYSDETTINPIGEFEYDPSTEKPYILNGEPQYHHGVKEWPLHDYNLVLNEN